MQEYWLNPPEPKVLCRCEYCAGEIYEYTEVRMLQHGVFVHDDCLLDWAMNEYKLIEIEEDDVR